MVDGGQLAHQRHLIHGLIEVDVTDARHIIRTHRTTTGETLSFTAFILACLGRAIDQHKSLLSYKQEKMMNQPTNNAFRRRTAASLGTGVTLGLVLGIATGNIALGLVLGILAGGLGTILKKRA